MKYFRYIFLLVVFPIWSFAQDSFHYPVDIVYHEIAEQYYVSNWADTNAGYILKLDIDGQIIEKYVDDLHYPGGICLWMMYYTLPTT